MSSFTKPLVVEVLKSGRDFKLRELFYYSVRDLDSGIVVEVPVGYVTDFASIPRFLWSLLPPIGKYGKAAVVHDFLCTHQNLWISQDALIRHAVALGLDYENLEGGIYYVTRKQADQIFLEAMAVLGVPKWKRLTMYGAVRLYAKFNGLDKDRDRRTDERVAQILNNVLDGELVA